MLGTWFKRAFRGLTARDAPEVVMLRSAEAAGRFPVQVPLGVGGRSRDQAGPCEKCGGAMAEVLFTTGGPGGDAALWRERPVAIDGFLCRACESIQVPRRMEPAEITALGRQAGEHARQGRLDEAELAFRRICNSWPMFAPGRLDLARLMVERVEHEEPSDRQQHLAKRYLDIAESQLRDALRGNLVTVPYEAAVEQLVLTLLRRDAEGAALAAIEDALARPGLAAEDRAKIEPLRELVRKRGDLFRRGAAAIHPHMKLDDKPWTAPDARGRRQITEGISLLERYLRADPSSWQACFHIGKGHQSLGDVVGFGEALGRAFRLDPNASVCREYTLALIETERFEEAERVAQLASSAAPEDAGLVANLALVMLLAGKVDHAQETVHRALAMAHEDRITQALARRIGEVRRGERSRPRTMAELLR
jgi:tetratricopeptide (TPR) repeat protein